MSISQNYFNSSTTSAGYVNPIVWSPESEKYIYENSVFQALGKTDGRQLNVPGKQYNFNFGAAYSMSLLTEGVETPVSSYDYTQVVVTFKGYGDAKQISKEELAMGFSYILSDIQLGAFGSMTENRDSVIATELLNTSTTGIYPGTSTSSTVTTASVLDTNMVAKVETTMEQSQAKKCGAIVIHPLQKYSLLVNSNFIDASKYGSDRVIHSGEIGEYLGIPIYVSNHITSATENSLTVYKAVALGRDPFVFMPKRNFEFNFEEETKRDRTVTASWWEMFGVKILRNESVIILTSVGGY